MLGVCLKYTQNNYGSKLQALATVKMFEQLGLNYEIIRYNKKNLRFYLKSIPRFFNWVFISDRYLQVQRMIQFKKHPHVKAQVDVRNKAFDSFDVHFSEHLSPIYSSYESLKIECPKRYDCVITCSDQLWSPSALGSGFYNLNFVGDDILKISWSSSFGVKRIPWYQIRRTRKYLERIEYISMRENRGKEIVKELTGKDVPVLMDPVFAFDKDAWNKMIPATESEWGKYIFCYFLGSNAEHRIAAERIAKEKNLKIVTLRHLDEYVKEDESFGDYAPYNVDPVRFLNILRNAEYICTDSFHGTAFSIIFEKKFIVFDRYSEKSSNSKNSRIDSLCNNVGLKSRRYVDLDSAVTMIDEHIDYSLVAQALAEYRENTVNYLEKALKN